MLNKTSFTAEQKAVFDDINTVVGQLRDLENGTPLPNNVSVSSFVDEVMEHWAPEAEKLGLEHVRTVHYRAEDGARNADLREKFDCVVSHRGKGLMQGLVCTLPVGQVSAKALEQGLIIITAGADVIRMVPPLVIEKKHVDEMIEKLEKALLAVKG